MRTLPRLSPKTWILVILVLYFLGGLYAKAVDNNGDFYPFFSWSLFSRVPDRFETDFRILLHRAGNETFENPVLLETTGYYNKRVDLTEYRFLIQNVAQAIRRGGVEEIAARRAELERNFLVRPVAYEIATVRYSPIERWKRGAESKLEITGSVGTFSVE